MNAQQVAIRLQMMGLYTVTVPTYGPDNMYQRIRIYYQGGNLQHPISLGHALLVNNRLERIRWYHERSRTVTEWCFFRYSWAYFMLTGQALSRDKWAIVVTKSNNAANKLRFEREQWRRDNPQQGKPHRGKLAAPHPHRFVMDYILAEK